MSSLHVKSWKRICAGSNQEANMILVCKRTLYYSVLHYVISYTYIYTVFRWELQKLSLNSRSDLISYKSLTPFGFPSTDASLLPPRVKADRGARLRCPQPSPKTLKQCWPAGSAGCAWQKLKSLPRASYHSAINRAALRVAQTTANPKP